jgi:hypothetical protein
MAKKKITNKQNPKTHFEKVWEWLEALEPLNKKATIAEKLLAHFELKGFIKQFILDEQ